MNAEHTMSYMAGLGEWMGNNITEPQWVCSCGRWRFRAKPMPRRRTGNNQREAELSFQSHRDGQPGAYGAGPGYN